MSEPTNTVFFRPNQGPLWTIGVTCLVLFALAVLLELFRRYKARRAAIRAEWKAAEDRIRECGVSEEEWKLLETVVRRHSPDSPMTVVTNRRVFSQCADSYMNQLLQQGNARQYREVGQQLRTIRDRLGFAESLVGRRFETTRDLGVGQTVWFSPVPTEHPKWLRGYVVAADEAYFHLALSEAIEQAAPQLSAGDHVQCRFWHENEARYVFTAVIASSEEKVVAQQETVGQSPKSAAKRMIRVWSLFHTSKLERVQARAFYRVPFTEIGRLTVVSSAANGSENDDSVDRSPIQGRFVNLSAGGFALVTRQYVRQAIRVRTTIEIPGEGAIQAEAIVLAVEELSGGVYMVRARFVRISEEEQDAIARFALHRQQPPVGREGA